MAKAEYLKLKALLQIPLSLPLAPRAKPSRAGFLLLTSEKLGDKHSLQAEEGYKWGHN